MPSFRVIAAVGLLRPAVAPTTIQPAVADAAADLAVVEATSIDVVRGEARLTVRFTADDVSDALRIAEHTVTALRTLAEVSSWRLTERVGGRWFRRA